MELSEEEKLKKAKLRILNLLQRRSYTEYELRRKLSDSGYDDPISDEAIEYVRGLDLIDDFRYCRNYISYNSSRKSRKRMAADLQLKGVSKDLIREAMDSVADEGDLAEEDQLIRKLMEKRHYDPADASFEDKQKMKSYLYGKGFDPDAIGRCL